YLARLSYTRPGGIVYATPLPMDDPGTGGVLNGAQTPIRITPANSRNTCGYFSPDGKSLIFASTAGQEDPNEPSSGYQRQGGNYRWDFPKGMEIYRVDDWQGKMSAASRPVELNLATWALTNNDAYDAECAFSPDGKWI